MIQPWGLWCPQRLMWPPGELTLRRTFQDCCCWCPHPCDEPLPTHTSTGDPPTPEDSFGSAFCGVIALFLWVLVHARFCLCSPRVPSLFSPVLWKSYIQIIMSFKIRFPGDFLSLCQTGKTHMGLRTFTTVGELLWYYYSSVCGSPTLWVWNLILHIYLSKILACNFLYLVLV